MPCPHWHFYLCFSHFLLIIVIIIIIIIIIIIVWLNRHLINQNTLHNRMNLLHLYGFYICSLLQLRRWRIAKNFPFCRAAERHFQCLAGPINVSVDLKYDFLCLWVFMYGIPAWVWRSNRLEVWNSGWNSTYQPYIESTTVLSDNMGARHVFELAIANDFNYNWLNMETRFFLL